MPSTYQVLHICRYYPETARSPDRRTNSITSLCRQRRASLPQTCHHTAHDRWRKEVPLARPWLPSVRITSDPTPTATTSGFTRWSAVYLRKKKVASTALFVNRSYRQYIISISRRSDLFPGTRTGVAGTASPVSFLYLQYGKPGATSMHDVHPNLDIYNSSIYHQMSSIPKMYWLHPLPHYRQIQPQPTNNPVLPGVPNIHPHCEATKKKLREPSPSLYQVGSYLYRTVHSSHGCFLQRYQPVGFTKSFVPRIRIFCIAVILSTLWNPHQ